MGSIRRRKTQGNEVENDKKDELKDPTPVVLESAKLEKDSKCTGDRFIVLILTILALGTRFYRLAQPPAVVFDELHFSKFVDRILTNTWFFDIHPPLGKLVLAYVSYALGYRPEPTFVIEKIGNEYPAHVKYAIVRGVSATFSVFTIPLAYLIARKLRISQTSSLVAAAAVLLDFLGVIEGRLILMDSQLLFFCQLSLYCALHLWETEKSSRSRLKWLTLTGLASGAALSIKHTALATPGLIAIVSFFGIHYLSFPLDLVECIYAGLCGLSVYVTSFYIMFKALWKTGGKYDNFMPQHFKRTLIGNALYNPAAKRVSFPRLFMYLNRRMVHSNANIKKRHSWESDWYQWIVNWRGVLYYVKRTTENGQNYKSQIYLLGNPVVIYYTLGCMFIFLLLLAVSIRYRQALHNRLTSQAVMYMRGNGIFLLWGWLCNLLPYILVHRAAFIYHYLPGLFYGQLLSALLLDLIPPKMRFVTGAVVIMTMVAAFVYWAPWIYGLPITDKQHEARRWLPRWT